MIAILLEDISYKYVLAVGGARAPAPEAVAELRPEVEIQTTTRAAIPVPVRLIADLRL